MHAVDGVNELPSEPQTLSIVAKTACEQIVDAKFVSNLLGID